MFVEFASAFVGSLLGQLPLLLVWVAGIVVAFAQWHKHPRVSALLAGGLSILLLNALAGVVFTGYLPLALEQDGGAASVSAIIVTVNIVQNFISTVGWVLVLVAAFAARPALPQERRA
ncbi:MAG: hypothetical protein WBH90_01430 [Aggregatilineales bacterium]|nr:hypothetical protein [Chloroflexota bacterium]HOA23761.1 hypothetical protein [Aggregatilineales bacterium]HPV06101.1 hypothetical protein [Aggregatilineales bacterium]HQE20007.1 hypothetical protein [Aggregatilineales bacterium]